jgi:hypothetical protein
MGRLGPASGWRSPEERDTLELHTDITATLLDVLDQILARSGGRGSSDAPEAADVALADTRSFLAGARSAQAPGDHERHLAVLHTIDHLDRLVERLRAAPTHSFASDDLSSAAAYARDRLAPVRDTLRSQESEPPVEVCASLAAEIAERRRTQRVSQLQAAAAGRINPDTALAYVDGMRWLDTSIYHVWGVMHHLAARTADTQTEPGS